MKRIVLATILFAFFALANAQAPLKKVYDENRNPLEQIDQALANAQKDGKFVVCQVGGNWCPWCLRFADFISTDSTISNLIDKNFIYIHVNYNPRQKEDAITAQRTSTMMKRLGNPARFGFPVFVVLDSKGKVIHIQDSSFLEEGKGYNKEKVLRFFANWTPEKVNG